jgi:hypothetical protein
MGRAYAHHRRARVRQSRTAPEWPARTVGERGREALHVTTQAQRADMQRGG